MEPTQHPDIFDRILERKVAFLVVFFVVCMLTYGVLFAIDFLPEKPSEDTEDAQTQTEESVRADVSDDEDVAPVAPYPERIIIDALDRDVAVLNPQSRAIADLDAALLKGVVRHPDSADFSHDGTMVLFGHSSYLPTVHNRNYQAFNGLQDLTWGDTIRVHSADTEYVYRVQKVYQTKASEASVALDNSEATLTLVTCNTFGSKDDRFIVEADLVETRAL